MPVALQSVRNPVQVERESLPGVEKEGGGYWQRRRCLSSFRSWGWGWVAGAEIHDPEAEERAREGGSCRRPHGPLIRLSIEG
ncbi:hypothetical protein BHE74_00039890 [Ensete ventricosum]|nr:hypothetical protein BHE74_00039890 [Ensete ventricosum]